MRENTNINENTENNMSARNRIRLGISLTREDVEWIDKEVEENAMFYNRSHLIEYSLNELRVKLNAERT